ncbi:plant invertase/pectin methylesterase inhibitor superfamily [Actinidia rufa]|uniref:Plant invertase/pectin methylesterase inhibitor superfamily n=1 Tax=Actinidia rufa TaxID=165716 RepID=A0A7J0DMM2_9ERIC|nr:plant invertase/pectin methylesterase inhibitor superfamily [Actinidia rufa]
MAFQDFDLISERRQNEKKQKLKKKIIIGSVSAFVLLLVIASAGAPPPHNPKIFSRLPSRWQPLSSTWPSIRPPPSNLRPPNRKGHFEDCMVLLQDATEELYSSISHVDGQNLGKLSTTTPELNNWLSAVIAYQQTCIDGFPEGELKSALQKELKNTKELTSNALAIISQVTSVFSNFVQAPPANRHLLSTDKDGLPSWMTHEDRRMLKGKSQKFIPNVIVAKDGSGTFKTISDALAAIPPKYAGRYIIYVKEGVYEEYVTVTKKMVNVTMYGDGSQKTIITGSKNNVDGVRTFQTATFAALGDSFMAQSMGFRNTAEI